MTAGQNARAVPPRNGPFPLRGVQGRRFCAAEVAGDRLEGDVHGGAGAPDRLCVGGGSAARSAAGAIPCDQVLSFTVTWVPDPGLTGRKPRPSDYKEPPGGALVLRAGKFLNVS